MKYSDEIKNEILEQEKIKKLKSLIKKELKEYTDFFIEYGIASSDEREESKKLYSTCISELNKRFYDYSIGNMITLIKGQEKISVPKNDIVYLMNIEHLKYYKSMLNKFYKVINVEPIKNHESFIAIANDIGTRAKNYFEEQNNSIPINDLVLYLKKSKGVVRKRK